MNVVVVGGGISGLAAAHRLAELSREKRLELKTTLLEAQQRFGGLIETQRDGEFLLEGGPDAFLAEKPWAVELCRRLGIESELIQTERQDRRSAIVHRGKLIPVPEGVYLLAPVGLKALLATSVLTLRGKLRVACEPFVPAAGADGDESVAQFVRRRFGAQALEWIAGPMLAGITAADPESLSARAVLPRFVELEQRFGSVSRGLLAGGNGIPGAGRAGGARYALFVTLRGGMERLVEALSRSMPEVEMRTGAAVARMERQGSGWQIFLEDGSCLQADQVCLALPPHRAAALLRPVAASAAEELSAIRSESVVTVNLAFWKEDLPRKLQGFGFVVPAAEGRRMIGCSFSSVKFAGRAPADSVLLRVFLGGALDRSAIELEDHSLMQMVRQDLRELLGIAAPPLRVLVRRYPQAMPQYEVGHLERVERIEQAMRAVPGLHLAGSGYRGVGIPDCIRQAERAAEQIVEEIQQG